MDLILDMFEHCLLRLPQIELPTMASSDKEKSAAPLDQDDLLIIEQSGAEGSECHQKGGAGQTMPQSIIDTPPLVSAFAHLKSFHFHTNNAIFRQFKWS